MSHIFLAIANAIRGIVLEIMKVFTGQFWDDFEIATISSDFKVTGKFDEYFPGMMQFRQILVYFALALILMAFVVHLMTVFLPRTNSSTGPGFMLGRYIAAFVGVALSYRIMAVVQYPFALIYDEFAKLNDTYSGSLSDKLEHGGAVMSSISGHTDSAISETAGAIIVIGLVIAILFSFMKLVLEMIERYLMICLLFYTCPLGFALIVDPDGGKFRNWIEMVLTEYLMMFFNIIFLYVFCYAYTSNSIEIESTQTLVIYCCCLIGWLNLGTKVDQITRTLGFATAQTGGIASGAAIGATALAFRGAYGIGKGAVKKGASFLGGKATGMTDKVSGIDGTKTGQNGNNIKDVAQESAMAGGRGSKMSADNVGKAEDLTGMHRSGAAEASMNGDRTKFNYGETDPNGNPVSMEMGTTDRFRTSSDDCLQTWSMGGDGQERVGAWSGSAEQAVDNADAFGASKLQTALEDKYGADHVDPVDGCPGAFTVSSISTDSSGNAVTEMKVAEVQGLYQAQDGYDSTSETLGRGEGAVKARFTDQGEPGTGTYYRPKVAEAGGYLVEKPATAIGKMFEARVGDQPSQAGYAGAAAGASYAAGRNAANTGKKPNGAARQARRDNRKDRKAQKKSRKR